MPTATATAHPNIALIKYWGKRDRALNLPAVPSLSLTLDTFTTTTTVQWGADADSAELNNRPADQREAARIFGFLDLIDSERPPCRVVSRNDFPTAAGLASSSSAFAALAVAGCGAAGQQRDLTALSDLARRGSGSACRSLWGGFVQWDLGREDDGSDSVGHPVAPAEHWDVRMVIAVVSDAKKAIASRPAMERTAATSPYYDTWVNTAPDDVTAARQAVLDRDLDALGLVMEQSTNKMHATMTTATPPVFYAQPGTMACLHAVHQLRADGVSAWATMDAGPNVKVLCATADAERVAAALRPHAPTVRILGPGGGPTLSLS